MVIDPFVDFPGVPTLSVCIFHFYKRPLGWLAWVYATTDRFYSKHIIGNYLCAAVLLFLRHNNRLVFVGAPVHFRFLFVHSYLLVYSIILFSVITQLSFMHYGQYVVSAHCVHSHPVPFVLLTH